MDKHLKIVREATWDVRAQWRDLGVELGINVGTLNVNASTMFVGSLISSLSMLSHVLRQLSATTRTSLMCVSLDC